MTDPVIVASDLGRRFGETVAVSQLELTVQAGEVFGFLGHNGAGKTTTIRMLNGILTPTTGSARVLGLDPMVDGTQLRSRTGVLTETPSLDERLTGRDNLTIYADLYRVPKDEVQARVDELLTGFDLIDRADDKAGGYSKGMKQRLALARTLLHKPEILFLDEPTSGLDPVAARQVHEMILQTTRQQGHTVFLCTHNLVEAQRLCDRVGVMEHGKLVALGSPRDLARQLVTNLTVDFEVDASSVPGALQALTAGGVTASAGQQAGTILVSGAAREQIPDQVSLLVNAGIRIYGVTPQEPTLEDVYFALHGEEPVQHNQAEVIQ
ncbi:MAG: ABC transporter ATP-binding protein [Anaerolineales bacterium]|nr:ABC transporter ATP-binding protein [Anaerolineae bacterium]MCB9132583.1 ABC transporter ATP-binding protein [Anaerolineales bacterium]MCB9141696.1 ABC transporter ATP-binding protein [Anaerolineales bacterium]MCO5244710.1 ABC transporter ATP-binding protein [Anaerolineae bacterium]